MRGSVILRGNTYTIIFDVGVDADGKRKQKWIGGFKTKREAERALAAAIADVERGVYVPPAKMSTADYLREWHKFHQYKVSREVWDLYGKRIEH